MGPGVRRGDGFLANLLRYVIPTKVGTHNPQAKSQSLKSKRKKTEGKAFGFFTP